MTATYLQYIQSAYDSYILTVHNQSTYDSYCYIREVEFHSVEPAMPAEQDLRNVDQSQCSLKIEHQSAASIINTMQHSEIMHNRHSGTDRQPAHLQTITEQQAVPNALAALD